MKVNQLMFSMLSTDGARITASDPNVSHGHTASLEISGPIGPDARRELCEEVVKRFNASDTLIGLLRDVYNHGENSDLHQRIREALTALNVEGLLE